MRIKSNLTKKEYLRVMKGSMDSMISFSGEERFHGIFLGSFFSVTHCAGHELNRRITNEKNRAMGFVREKDGGAEVSFITLKGMTNPLSLILIYVLHLIIFAVSDPILLSDGKIWLLCFVGTMIVAGITAVTDSLTDRGEEGYRILMRLLHNPENFTRWYE